MHKYPIVLPLILGTMTPSMARELDRTPHGTLITVDIPQYEDTLNRESISLFVSLSEPHHSGETGTIRINDYELKRNSSGRGDGRLKTPEDREIVAAWKFRSNSRGEEELKLTILAIDDENVSDLEVSISLKQTYDSWISAVEGSWVTNVASKPLEAGEPSLSGIDTLGGDLDSKLSIIETLVTEIAHHQEQISSKQQLVAQIYDSNHRQFGEADHHLRQCDTLRCFLASVKRHIQRGNDTAPDGVDLLDRELKHEPHDPKDHHRHHRCDEKRPDHHLVRDSFPICYPQQKDWFDETTPDSQYISDVTRAASSDRHVYQQNIECHSPQRDHHHGFPFAEAILGVLVIGAAIFLFRRRFTQRKSWMQSLDGPTRSRWNLERLTGLAFPSWASLSQPSSPEMKSNDKLEPQKFLYTDEQQAMVGV
ncbi:hypothetical protein G7054_g4660 [Neopestalotiopsis clavispora]|nr:hypothetical protein G7054_g4660 [Neopestalotiopsis clavispora]